MAIVSISNFTIVLFVPLVLFMLFVSAEGNLELGVFIVGVV